MNLNDLPPFLEMRDIVSTRKPERRNGLVPFGRSKWLELRRAGKIPQGRQAGAKNSATIYTREEVLEVLEKIEAGELGV